MPTRKKGPARNATVEHVNTKTSRHPRRSTSSAVPDKKVNDLITSSSKKQKPAENLQKKNEVLSGGRKLTSLSDSTDTENEVANVPSSSMLDHKVTDPAIDRTSAEIACTLEKKLKAVAKKRKGGSQKLVSLSYASMQNNASKTAKLCICSVM